MHFDIVDFENDEMENRLIYRVELGCSSLQQVVV